MGAADFGGRLTAMGGVGPLVVVEGNQSAKAGLGPLADFSECRGERLLPACSFATANGRDEGANRTSAEMPSTGSKGPSFPDPHGSTELAGLSCLWLIIADARPEA